MSVAVDSEKPPRPGLSVVKRMALAALIIMLSTAAAVATAALLEIKDDVTIFIRAGGVHNRIKNVEGALDNVSAGGPQTILVLGSDRRFIDKKTGAPARSDTMLLIRLDPSKAATTVMSVPRDLRVQIPGHGMGKINQAYEQGGPVLAVKTVRNLLHIPISHVVNVNFGGFQRAVDRLGCVYMDVDRTYYHSNAGLPPSAQYSEINVKAGYQRLCGENALAFVRFRHADSDLVRAARQQDFLREAKDQIGVNKIFSDRKTLLKIFGRYTQTDIGTEAAILRLLKLAVQSASNPVQQIQFEPVSDIPGSSDLAIAPATLQRLARQFMDAKSTKSTRAKVKKTASDKAREKRQKKQKRRSNSSVPAGLFLAQQGGEDQAVRLATDPKHPLSFPVYYPKLAVLGSTYVTSDNRAYRILDRDPKKKGHEAYRIVASAPGIGQYYGVEGTTWKDAPILGSPTSTKKVNGRTLKLYGDGGRLRLVAWSTPRAVYWVSNTLLQSLTNGQMIAIADSLTRPGS
ncbi:LCP family protein [Paraconexibacter antarcticus]|uniref:LCP family protein n=1 Tax=Paraconexibacter antarcticus TaxID=2949664 RepID=A0ABY5DX18_9ACTN|nr:LCP family protein [Paraconexibacter antarcticus]UTI65848.1 LCP family protein [Paraconexibacter antarcticus]